MITLDGASLAPPTIAAVARGGAEVELSAAAAERNLRAREVIAARLDRDLPLYGASTGVGALRDRPVEDEERERSQWNLLRSHAVTAGRPVRRELVRAGMVVRANQLGAGGAGVAPELLERLVCALNEDLVPEVRELGSLGTGDLPGLAEIALGLLEGHPEIRLGLRDALGFMSSNALTIARGALIAVDALALQERWIAVAALSFEATSADPVVLDERVQQARGARGQAIVARRLRELLEGMSPEAPVHERLVQDPFPFRVLPQVEGVSRDALLALAEVVTRESGGRGENALVVDGLTLPNGNFDATELAAALDSLRIAFAGSASLMAARVGALMDPRFTGLTPFLAEDPGPDSGVMMLEYTAQAAAAEARSLAMPMTAQAVWASLGVETHASLAATAARRTEELLEAMEVLVATELVVAVRALRLAGRVPAGAATAALYERAAGAVSAEMGDRVFGRDVELARQVLSSSVLGETAKGTEHGSD